ncbi:MAG TPA: HEAT repeat domain-containing protein, partial [Methanoregulaceae archaeon]|nr:HEAT repeat domain-containing protein [Methanoregulaceae archaeon]
KIDASRGVEFLCGCLKDFDPNIRRLAAQILGDTGDPRAVESLIDQLKEPHMREDSAEALGKIGDSRAIEPLISSLKDSDPKVRKRAANSLVSFYHSGKLDPEKQKMILANKSVIQAPHTDNTKQSDCSVHEDSGIGISF